MAKGNKLHSVLENVVNSQDVRGNLDSLAENNLEHMTPVLDKLLEYECVAELELGVKADWSPCDFWDNDIYGRCKIDVIAFNEASNTTILVDWKTGKPKNKKYQGPQELQLHACILKAHYPELAKIGGYYCYTQDGSFLPEKTPYNLSNIEAERAKVDELMGRINYAMEKDNFGTRKNNLCPWCEVKHCKHCKPREDRR